MKYSKENISKFAKETDFIPNNIEKVVRLLDVLEFVFTKSSFKNAVILKGGTAINLIHTNLSRLSVDINLDYIGSLDKESTLINRHIIEDELDAFMEDQEYLISPKSRSSYALFSRVYKFRNYSEADDVIKIDINFMDRIHLFDIKTTTVTYFDKTITLKTPTIEELYGMKVNALIDRSKPRDLYDGYFLVQNLNLIDVDQFRKSVVFYLSLNSIFDLNKHSFDLIKEITDYKLKTELKPVLKKHEYFDLKHAQTFVIEELTKLLKLKDHEKQYLVEFSKGNYQPSLLFNEQIALQIEKHPMALWAIANIKK